MWQFADGDGGGGDGAPAAVQCVHTTNEVTNTADILSWKTLQDMISDTKQKLAIAKNWAITVLTERSAATSSFIQVRGNSTAHAQNDV